MKTIKISPRSILQATEKGRKWMERVELLGGIFLCTGLLLNYLHIYTGNLLLAVSLQTLFIIYLFIGFFKFNSPYGILSLLFYKIYGFGLALCSLILIIIVNHWNFFQNSYWLFVVLTFLLLSVIQGIWEKLGKNANKITWLYFFRILVIYGLLSYFLLVRSGFFD